MANQNNTVKQAIKTYLDKRAAEDQIFAQSYAKPGKSINQCFDYILGEVRKQGNAVYMSDEEVFSLAVHYYDEDDIKISPLHAGTQVQAKSSVPLTDEEKATAKEQALQEYKQQQIAQLKAAEKAQAEKRKSDIERRKQAEPQQPTLFQFD